MGILRGIWRSTALGRTVDTIKNIVDEGNIVNGVKRTIKEDYTEDDPITSAICRSEKYDWKKEGYTEASAIYEEKLLEQADKFLTQEKVFESERDEYEKLLDEYEAEIENLTEKVNRTEVENAYLQQLLLKDRMLRRKTNKI